MRMSTKGRFGVNAMIDLALRERAGPVALAQIASRQQISLSYLEQVFSRLRRTGLVASTRGPGGGYTLGRDAETISVADILVAVEDDEPADAHDPVQVSATLWAGVHEVMLRHLAGVSLRSLADEQRASGFVPDARPVTRPHSAPSVSKPTRSLAPNSVFAFGQSFSR